jgi:stearoyl-CoA desaturase (delta-9 desaturase)
MRDYSRLTFVSYLIGPTQIIVSHIGALLVLMTGLSWGSVLWIVLLIVGDQPFITDDHSRNNGFVAFLNMGEGWHNLHHAFQSSSRHGITIRAGQVVYLPDPTFCFIKMLEFLKLASKLRLPAETDLLARSKTQSFQHSGLPAPVETSVNS